MLLCRDFSDYESDDDTGHDGDDAAAVRDTGIGQSQLPVGAGDPSGSIFDMQLPIAGMQLLAGLMARSNDALEWFARDPDRCVMLYYPAVVVVGCGEEASCVAGVHGFG